MDGFGPDSVTYRRAAYFWAFIERFPGLTPEAFDELTVDRFEAGIAYIEQAKAAEAATPKP
ncbi:hypothetical protein [Streptomyces sp. NBC_01262]|uniref:hypothetical protein n=1 Tax=Streptomyces sp. NBC_01262 TaxID=2903803 RepID=UPI002E306833|nr:hypothetical protein [Streptomyces sp. NBC_01262]